jgi:hypothetical protein
MHDGLLIQCKYTKFNEKPKQKGIHIPTPRRSSHAFEMPQNLWTPRYDNETTKEK